MYLHHDQDKDFFSPVIHIYDFSDAAKMKHLHWLVLSYFFPIQYSLQLVFFLTFDVICG